mmetsp:Transcript_65772/g.208177  ORF Transcript_65772/g.208177 Transcript_65772/m.208177 type:complete len:231 (-) Transcript_65772:1351-2043(-)
MSTPQHTNTTMTTFEVPNPPPPDPDEGGKRASVQMSGPPPEISGSIAGRPSSIMPAQVTPVFSMSIASLASSPGQMSALPPIRTRTKFSRSRSAVRNSGTLPVSSLSETSKTCRRLAPGRTSRGTFEKQGMSFRYSCITPENLFLAPLKMRRAGYMNPGVMAGRGPSNSLSAMLSSQSSLSDASAIGRVPEKLLLAKLRRWSRCVVHDVGRGPENLFRDAENVSSSWRLA